VFRLICGLSLVLLAWSCASVSPPIRLEATPTALELLVGEWYGDYVGDDPPARHGTIVFKLVEGEDHAHGDVLMIPAGSTRAYERYHSDPSAVVGRDAPRQSQMLTIRIVRTIDGSLTGQLDSYWDPDRDCVASTTFRGAIGDGVIGGTFTTKCGASGAPDTTGRWKVTRLPPRTPR
jgi:hypothetical protein